MLSRYRSFILPFCLTLLLVVTSVLSYRYYQKNRLTSEATSNIMKIYNGEMAYYLSRSDSFQKNPTEFPFALIPWTPTFPPTKASRDGGFKYDKRWNQLFFKEAQPVHYSYRVSQTLPEWYRGKIPQSPFFVVEATGDINGNGIFSHFIRIGALTSDGKIDTQYELQRHLPYE